MSRLVSIVDYGIGNLFSVSRAVEQCGGVPLFIKTPEELLRAERLILPGVGAFADGMAGLRAQNLIEAIQEYGGKGRPLLGICLGMQMLLETNEEFGLHEGLGLIPGRVSAIPNVGADGQSHKIPHIGWSSLQKIRGDGGSESAWEGTVLADIPEGTTAYFVHSFTAFPSDETYRLADADYNGQQISAVVRAGNIYGCQFHPEKSGPWGLKMVENFINLN